MRKTFLYFVLAISFLLISMSFVANAQNTKKYKLKRNKPKKTVTIVTYDTPKTRQEIEKLMLSGEYLHDGSGELYYVGTMKSVPALLKVLEVTPVKEVNGKIQAICTYFHALKALQKITGQHFVRYQDWKDWWEKYQSKK